MHLTERWIRLGVGAILLALYLWGPKTSWELLGLFFVASGITGFCPVWKILGISTLKKAPAIRKTAAQSESAYTKQEDRL